MYDDDMQAYTRNTPTYTHGYTQVHLLGYTQAHTCAYMQAYVYGYMQGYTRSYMQCYTSSYAQAYTRGVICKLMHVITHNICTCGYTQAYIHMV